MNRYLLIGNGRLSRHLQHYFRLEGLDFATWSRSEGVPLEEALEGADRVLLLISDDAIEPFLAAHAGGDRRLWMHCSGSLSTELADSAHPLLSFGDELYEVERYRRIPFVCERGRRRLPELIPELANPHFAIDSEDKPVYHALCAMAGNFTTMLWQKAFDDCRHRFGLPREVLLPYLESIAHNLEHASDPLTGPLARDDRAVIDRHLQELEGDPYHGVYRAFVAAHREAAERRTP
jgi:predicted short-subunit dehydrogenase-like oxidoreductase (DUF2520 family)